MDGSLVIRYKTVENEISNWRTCQTEIMTAPQKLSCVRHRQIKRCLEACYKRLEGRGGQASEGLGGSFWGGLQHTMPHVVTLAVLARQGMYRGNQQYVDRRGRSGTEGEESDDVIRVATT